MANEFLLKKWRHQFRAHDINKDRVLSVEDADIFSGNFCRFNNFDDIKSAKVKEVARLYWREWLLKGLDSADEETYVRNMEKAYLEDKEKFRKDARRLFSMVLDVCDVNHDKLLSQDEFRIMIKSTGFENYNESYMQCYPQIKPGYLCLELYLDVFVEFCCNDDINNIEIEKPRHFGMGIFDITKDI